MKVRSRLRLGSPNGVTEIRRPRSRRRFRNPLRPDWDRRVSESERIRNDHFERRFYAGRFI